MGEKEGLLGPFAFNHFLLVGTLAFLDRDNLRRPIIQGVLGYFENIKFKYLPEEQFEWIHFIPPNEDLNKLPKDGEFNGLFNIKTKRWNIKIKSCTVPESGVKLTFKLRDESREILEVHGTGLNNFGTFELHGTAMKNSSVFGRRSNVQRFYS